MEKTQLDVELEKLKGFFTAFIEGRDIPVNWFEYLTHDDIVKSMTSLKDDQEAVMKAISGVPLEDIAKAMPRRDSTNIGVGVSQCKHRLREAAYFLHRLLQNSIKKRKAQLRRNGAKVDLAKVECPHCGKLVDVYVTLKPNLTEDEEE